MIDTKVKEHDTLTDKSIVRIKAEAMRREKTVPDEGCNTCTFLNPAFLEPDAENTEIICFHSQTTLPDILVGTWGKPCRYYVSIFKHQW